jgi:hypothetical protein
MNNLRLYVLTSQWQWPDEDKNILEPILNVLFIKIMIVHNTLRDIFEIVVMRIAVLDLARLTLPTQQMPIYTAVYCHKPR